MNVPDLPCLDCVVDDSPLYHQSLKYWGSKANELYAVMLFKDVDVKVQIGRRVHEVASGLHHYHETGNLHHKAGNHLSEVLGHASKFFENDETLAEPLGKFSDALNRMECYKDMLLQQTEMLGVDPLMKMVKEVEKMKKCKTKLAKASESLHISWAKYSNLPHIAHLQEPQQLDRYAHTMITWRQKYQLLLAQYTESIRNINTQKKVLLLQKALEHMLAEFSYFNYCSQILKELEPYMNTVFEDVREKLEECEKISTADEIARTKVEADIDAIAQNARHAYPAGDHGPTTAQSTGRFLKQVGGFISSGVKEMKKSYKDGTPAKAEDWEVIDTPAAKEALEEQDETLSSPRSTSISQSSHFYLPLNNPNKTSNEEVINDDTQHADEVKAENLPKDSQDSTDIDGIRSEASKKIQEFRKNNKVSPTHRSTHDDDFFKKGYLRIKQKAFPKSKYPLLYFILDKKYGELLSQGQDQKHPTSFAKLQLSAVKRCGEETDRNFCFQIVTSDAEHTLQAQSQEEMRGWIEAIQQGIATALTSNQNRGRSNARGRSVKDYTEEKKAETQCHNAVERIKAVDGNLYCADCQCPRPGWASANIGVVICIECSGVHRSLGVHISKVKSLSLDKWENTLVEHMERHGNTKVNMVYEANLNDQNKIQRDSSKKKELHKTLTSKIRSDRSDFIRKKYVERLFYLEKDDEEENLQEDSKSVDEIDAEFATFVTYEDKERRVEVTDSIMCLVKDCEDCKTGRHGNVNPPSDDSPNFSTTRLRLSPDLFGGEQTQEVPESTL